MDVVSVIGAGQNSGKTTAVEALVREFVSRGLRVGTIKQIHERNFTLDRRGKDSWRHAEAGARIVVLASPNEIGAIKRITDGNRYEESLRLLEGEDLDILIVEGHPGVNVPMVYAARDETVVKAKPVDDNVVCIVSLGPEKFKSIGLPVFHINRDIERIADLLLGELKEK